MTLTQGLHVFLILALVFTETAWAKVSLGLGRASAARGVQAIERERAVPVATAVTLAGPTTGMVGVASNNFTVGVNGTLSVTVMVTPLAAGGGTFTPTSVSLTAGSPTATFKYTAVSLGAKTITVMNNGGLANPAGIGFTATAPTPATAVTLMGPTSGMTGIASTNFTVGANGLISGTVTATPSDAGGGGTFTPASVNISAGSSTAMFTYTAVSTGAKTIGVTNNGGLSNPSGITFTAASSAGLPYTLPGPGQAVKIDINTFASVAPPGLALGQWSYAVFDSFGGHTFNPEYSAIGAWIGGCTGGHGHPSFTGIVGFDFLTAMWFRLDPANAGALPYDYSPPLASATNGNPWWEMNGQSGTPAVGHPYGQRNWIPAAWGGGSLGGFLVAPNTAVEISGQSSSPTAKKFDLSTRLWSRASPDTTLRADSSADTVIDVARQRYWVFTKTDHNYSSVQYIDATDWTFKTAAILTPAASVASGYVWMFNDVLMKLTGAPGLYLLDPDDLAAGWRTLTVSGALPTANAGRFAEYHGKLYSRLSNTTDNVLYRLTPPSDMVNGTWVADTVALNISLPNYSATLEHRTQLFNVPNLDCLAWVTGSGVYLIKPE